jgi:hypothetical protein
MNEFIECNSLEKRTRTSESVIEKYPGKVPVVVLIPGELTKKQKFIKYLISKDLNIQYIVQLVRKNIKIDPTKAIFLLTENGTLTPGSVEIRDLYCKHKNVDGYLYIYVRVENCFGC